jgi:predicted amidohydrolase
MSGVGGSMSGEKADDTAVALFGELFMADQLARNRISKVLPKGMELSHFSVLNHLARINDERTPAQTGFHAEAHGKGRRTHGHALAVAPWGEVLADAGTEPGVTLVDLDLARVAEARHRVPSLTHDRRFDGP